MNSMEQTQKPKRKGFSCTTEEHLAYLSEEFGMTYAMRHLGKTEEELEAIVGRYVRGKRKGLLKGAIRWTKVIVGGWHRDGYGVGNGHVVSPGEVVLWTLVDAWTGEPIAF